MSVPTDFKSSPYWWFQGSSVVRLAEQLDEVGPAVARLLIHKHGDTLYLQVVDSTDKANDADCPPINESHICPPQCP